MDVSAIDFPALLLGLFIAVIVTAALMFAHRGEQNRRGWMVAGGFAALLAALGLFDLLRESPRETHLGTPFVGAILPVLGGLGMVRATRRVRPWLRWGMVFVTTFVLLFAGVLLGAAIIAKYLS